jgi:hypothetical protein
MHLITTGHQEILALSRRVYEYFLRPFEAARGLSTVGFPLAPPVSFFCVALDFREAQNFPIFFRVTFFLPYKGNSSSGEQNIAMSS